MNKEPEETPAKTEGRLEKSDPESPDEEPFFELSATDFLAYIGFVLIVFGVTYFIVWVIV